MAAELGDGRRIRCGHGAKLRVAVLAGRCDLRHNQIMDHPALVPTGFVVNDKQSGDIREDINERPAVVGIGRQARAWAPAQRGTAPNVGRWPLAAFAAVGIALSLIPGMIAVKIFGSKSFVSSR